MLHRAVVLEDSARRFPDLDAVVFVGRRLSYTAIDTRENLSDGCAVDAREIEELMIAHPAVSLAAVVGVRSDEYGKGIKAFMIASGKILTGERVAKGWNRVRPSGS